MYASMGSSALKIQSVFQAIVWTKNAKQEKRIAPASLVGVILGSHVLKVKSVKITKGMLWGPALRMINVIMVTGVSVMSA